MEMEKTLRLTILELIESERGRTGKYYADIIGRSEKSMSGMLASMREDGLINSYRGDEVKAGCHNGVRLLAYHTTAKGRRKLRAFYNKTAPERKAVSKSKPKKRNSTYIYKLGYFDALFCAIFGKSLYTKVMK